MEKIDEVVEKIRHFVSEKGKLTVLLGGILIFLFVSAIITAIVQCATTPKKVPVITAGQLPVNSDDLLAPQYGSFTEDYTFSRISNDKWSSDEVDRWFTTPNDSVIEDLGSANDALVNDITGAAP